MQSEEVSFKLILHSGNSYTNAIEAIGAAREGNYIKAEELMENAKEEMELAHKVQTELLFSKANGIEVIPDILLVHAQCHLNTATIFITMAKEFIETYKIIDKNI